MKTSVLSKYFVGVTLCFVMVFSSCGDLFEEFKLEAVLIYPSRMSAGDTYEFEVEIKESTGDLSYSWSVSENTNRFFNVSRIQPPPTEDDAREGELHSETGPVVSYTTPGYLWSGTLRVQVSVADAYNEVNFTAVYTRDGGFDTPNFFGVWQSID